MIRDVWRRHGPMLFGLAIFVILILIGLLRPDPPRIPPSTDARWAGLAGIAFFLPT